MPDLGYCKLFVDSKLRFDELVDLIRRETGGVLDRNYIDCSWGSFYLSRNDEYSSWKTSGDDGFLYYKYTIEVNKLENQDFAVYVDSLRGLIRYLLMLPAKVVAACDFEDRLKPDENKYEIK